MARPDATLEPLSLDLVAWDDQRFDVIYLGACGTSRRTTCQHFWQGGFSLAYDLGLPDAGAGVFASTIVSSSRTRLSVYAVEPDGTLHRTAWRGASWSPWQPVQFTSFFGPPSPPLGARVLDAVAAQAVQGEEAQSHVQLHDSTRAFFGLVAVTSTPTWAGAPWGSTTATSAPPTLVLENRPSVAVLPDAGFVAAEMTGAGVLALSAPPTWQLVPPAPVPLAPRVSPSCAQGPAGLHCLVASADRRELWVVTRALDAGFAWELAGALP